MTDFAMDHLHLLSRDAVAAGRFYEKMFDAKITISTGANGLPRCDVDINGQIIRVTTAAGDAGGPASGPHQQLGLDHIGLRVDNMDDAAARLEQRGVEFSRAPSTPRPGVRIAFIRAPDGVSIELVESDES